MRYEMGDPGRAAADGRPPVVLVTGGASGIGRAVVDEFVRYGSPVVVLDRDKPVEPFPSAVTVITGDVREPRDNDRAVAAAVRTHGRLDVFVGNAGVHDGGVCLGDRPAAELAVLARHVLDVNVVGYLLGARAAAEPLRTTGGCMIFTLSDASFLVQGNGSGVAYATAKHAALGLVRHLAADLAPHVRVNAVAPGGVVTGLRAVDPDGATAAVFADPEPILDGIRRLNPLGVVLTPAQLAPLYRFLASDLAAGLTGEVLRPDGGLAVR